MTTGLSIMTTQQQQHRINDLCQRADELVVLLHAVGLPTWHECRQQSRTPVHSKHAACHHRTRSYPASSLPVYNVTNTYISTCPVVIFQVIQCHLVVS